MIAAVWLKVKVPGHAKKAPAFATSGPVADKL